MNTEMNSQAGLMRLYILGLLTESEQITLEERFFDDGEMLGEMRAVEQDLVDAYVRGRLREDEKTNFERHYLSVPRHAERVAFARELLHLADAEPDPRPEPVIVERQEPFWRKWLLFFQGPQFAMGATLAMATILVFSGIFLFRERARWQAEIAKVQAERAIQEEKLRAMEHEIAREQANAGQLAADLERLRQEQRGAEEPPKRSIFFSFLLLPTSRGGNQQTIQLRPDVKQVRLQMNIESGNHQRYRARLEKVDGGRVWETISVKARPAGTNVSLSLLVPIGKLSAGDYILTLTGIAADGSEESIENYSFRVARK